MSSDGCPLSLKGRRLVAVAVIGGALLAGIAYYFYAQVRFFYVSNFEVCRKIKVNPSMAR